MPSATGNRSVHALPGHSRASARNSCTVRRRLASAIGAICGSPSPRAAGWRPRRRETSSTLSPTTAHSMRWVTPPPPPASSFVGPRIAPSRARRRRHPRRSHDRGAGVAVDAAVARLSPTLCPRTLPLGTKRMRRRRRGPLPFLSQAPHLRTSPTKKRTPHRTSRSARFSRVWPVEHPAGSTSMHWPMP
jgi:hypothetical protein